MLCLSDSVSKQRRGRQKMAPSEYLLKYLFDDSNTDASADAAI